MSRAPEPPTRLTSADAGSAPLDRPHDRVGAWFIARYAFAYYGMWVALLTPIAVSLALRIGQLEPEQTANQLSLVLSVGSLLAIAGNPFFGRLSDRTRSRFGMRRPWLVCGSVVGAIGLLLIAIAPGIPVLLLGWALAQLAFNGVLAALTAVLSDQVPAPQRGRVSGILGLCAPLAIVTGTYLTRMLAKHAVAMFMVPAAIGLVAILVFALTLDDRRLPKTRVLPHYGIAEFLRSFWVNPIRFPDFGWAWWSRLLMNWGYATAISFQVLFLTSRLGATEATVAGLVFVSSTILQVTAVAFSGIGGWVSDRIGRRKPIVLVAATLLAVGLGVAAFSSGVPAFFVGIAIAGVGQGLYNSLEFAVVSAVVTSPANTARDFGVSNIANALPQMIVPALAPFVLALPLFGTAPGEDYPALFLLGGLLALLGALTLMPIRRIA